MKLEGLVAATFTPFGRDGELNLAAVERQAEYLVRTGVRTVFVGGSTGESQSLSLEERLTLAGRWSEVAPDSGLTLIVHVGSNSLPDARAMAAHAQSLGAAAISAVGPSYFKPRSVETLVEWCEQLTAASPELPFYFYDIPSLTGIQLSMPAFLDAAAERLPTLAGIKFSNPDLLAYQHCLRSHGGRFDMPFGCDEYLLAALALGGSSGIGSSYNFAAPIYHRLIAALRAGDLDTAREEQYRSAQIISLLAGYGYAGAAKALLAHLGVDVGSVRLPNARLDADASRRLISDVERLGFFEWIA